MLNFGSVSIKATQKWWKNYTQILFQKKSVRPAFLSSFDIPPGFDGKELEPVNG